MAGFLVHLASSRVQNHLGRTRARESFRIAGNVPITIVKFPEAAATFFFPLAQMVTSVGQAKTRISSHGVQAVGANNSFNPTAGVGLVISKQLGPASG